MKVVVALLSNFIAKWYQQKMYTDYSVVELRRAVLLMINVDKHVSFTRLMSFRIRTVISTVVLVIEI